MFVGSYLATKVFIGNLPAPGRGWVIIKLANDERSSNSVRVDSSCPTAISSLDEPVRGEKEEEECLYMTMT